MKKSTLLVAALALFAGSASADIVEVTTADMNPETTGSLVNVLMNLPDAQETTITFNLDVDELNFLTNVPKADAPEEITHPAIPLINKIVVIDGKNKKTGNNVTINGTETTTFLETKENTKLTLKNLTISKFVGIAFKSSVTSTLIAEDCIFTNNKDVKIEKGNNGIIRLSHADAVFNRCVFTDNKATGSYGGGAICFYTGGNTSASLRVTNCTFAHNEAYSGGAISVNVRNKGAVPTVYIANCTFANNSVSDRGGAIYMQTAEVSGSFAPVMVNNTFVGNMTNHVTSDDGGAVNVWSRATTTMSPVFVNNLFVANCWDPWGKSPLNDVKAFYLEGALDVNGNPLPQTVNPVCVNNGFTAIEDTFYKTYADKNFKVDFAADAVFAEKEQNPWDEGDPEYNHQTAKLSGDLKVAMLAKESVAIGKGVATFEGVEIPTTDQLGNARPAAPALGAVEYTENSGVEGVVAATDAYMIKSGDVLLLNNVNGTVYIFDVMGSLVQTSVANDVVSIANLTNGVYVAKAANCVVKFVK